MQKFVWAIVLLLVILHQDFWFWEVGVYEPDGVGDKWLVFGFMPIGLFFHACISIAAAVTWLLATKFCWPTDLEHAATEPTGEEGGQA